MYIKAKADILQDEKWVEWGEEQLDCLYFIHWYTLNRTNENLVKYGSNYPFLKEGETPRFQEVPTEMFDFRDLLFNQGTFGDIDPDQWISWAEFFNEKYSISIVESMSDMEILQEIPENNYIVLR
tara:strand:+ start:446 stop:820 length:375 start_codon:yes stop_codon:yes gene_type:complete